LKACEAFAQDQVRRSWRSCSVCWRRFEGAHGAESQLSQGRHATGLLGFFSPITAA
jgi:hypothetical protein